MGHSRVRAEVSRRNAPAGRGSHHSSQLAGPSFRSPCGSAWRLQGPLASARCPGADSPSPHPRSCSQHHSVLGGGVPGTAHKLSSSPKLHALCRRGSERVNGMTLRSLSRAPLPRPLRRCRCATCQHHFPYLRCVYFRRGRSYTQLPTNPTRVVQRLFAWVHVCNLCADRDIKTDSSTQKVPSCQSPHLPWKVTSVQTPVSTD